ncbi:hypothetical protein [Methylorubrum thiocyanatum]|uniref:hypothetical protein n=1 Tax=Methylorubrum thiocyanatum TaxID=47958 RepID=UPI0035C8400E
MNVDPTRLVTEAELQESEGDMIKTVAQMHEGMILTLVSICATITAQGGATYDGLIAGLRATSEGMLKENQPALMHQPVDKLTMYLEQLRDGDAPRPPQN